MSESVAFKQDLLPYDDGSGFRYQVGVERRAGGAHVITIDAYGGLICIDAQHWPAIRHALDEATAFVEKRTSQ